MTDILSRFPYPTIRDGQEHCLTTIEREWPNYDVFVARMPVAAGKSGCGVAIQSWQLDQGKGCYYAANNNVLRDQILGDFDHLRTVKAQSDYWLPEYNMTEAEFRRTIYKWGPRGSQYSEDLKAARRVGTPVVGNYHTYIAHKLQRHTLIVDEAHQLLKTLQDMNTRYVWRHDVNYPDNIGTLDELMAWLESVPERTHKLDKLWDEVSNLSPSTVIQFGTATFRGDECECIKLFPLDVSGEAPIFWPPKVKKIVLMSATISMEDVEAMGLGTRRILFIDVPSPIPEERRPNKFEPIGKLTHSMLEYNLPKVAAKLLDLADKHPTKGFVHVTYDMARKLRPLLSDNPRFKFHTAANKTSCFNSYLESAPEDGQIMVGSGLTEGIDLKKGIADWQVLVKCPYPSLVNPAMRWLSENKPDTYRWYCTKEILQACGRICRSPDDFGVTYLLDSSFRSWYSRARSSLPSWFSVEGL